MDLVNGAVSRNGLSMPGSNTHPRVRVRSIAIQVDTRHFRTSSCSSNVTRQGAAPVGCVPEPPSMQSIQESIVVMEQGESRRKGEDDTEVQVTGPHLDAPESVTVTAGGNGDTFDSKTGQASMASALGSRKQPSLPLPASLPTFGPPAAGVPPTSPSPSPTYSPPESLSLLTPGRPRGPQTPIHPVAALSKHSGPSQSEIGGGGGSQAAQKDASSPAVATKGMLYLGRAGVLECTPVVHGRLPS